MPVVVQSRERALMLVVVPALTWAATVQVDEDADGMRRHARRRHAGQLAARVARTACRRTSRERVAPLLVFLDRAKIRYDLTSDLDLALSRAPARLGPRRRSLLAGSERWITRAYARRLRRYVLDGGRLASFGAESLRRGVTIQRNRDRSAGRFVRPTQPSIQDPFGTRFEDVRDTGDARRPGADRGRRRPTACSRASTARSRASACSRRATCRPTGRGGMLAALGVETAPEETHGGGARRAAARAPARAGGHELGEGW